MFLKLIILIDLIFTNQPNFVTESGVHPPLHTNCHHQIKFAKPNLRVEYPPLYERLIWDYKNADIQSINRVINTWVIPSKVNMLMNKSTSVTIVNIFHNYISNFSKLFFVMIKIHCGEIMKIKKILTRKLKQYIPNELSQIDYEWLLISNISN